MTLDESEFPPRGSGIEGRPEQLSTAQWVQPSQLALNWNWQPGKVVLGEYEDQIYGDPDAENTPGRGDDRHIITVAGSRSGKSTTVLIPNLLFYPGSMIVVDSKGELARATAMHRAKYFGEVVVLDPFGVSGLRSSTYNPLSELNPNAATYVDDVAQIAEALIIDSKGERHWTDSAKNLLRLVAFYMPASGGENTLTRLRKILLGSEGALVAPEYGEAKAADNLLARIKEMPGLHGLMSNLAASFMEKSEREMGSILSTAREQLVFLDSPPMQRVLMDSKVRLASLKKKPTTIYLCLPAGRMATHARWLRTIVNLALNEMERDPTVPEHPVFLMLDEFGALGYMRSIESAAGYMAGFGVRLWSFLQDFTQLKTHYPNSWETFIGNAGIVQAFANIDVTTTEHLSKMLGNTRVAETQDVQVNAQAMSHGDLGRREHIRSHPLLEPAELAYHFARETQRQLIIAPGRPPIFMNRLPRQAIPDETNVVPIRT